MCNAIRSWHHFVVKAGLQIDCRLFFIYRKLIPKGNSAIASMSKMNMMKRHTLKVWHAVNALRDILI